MPLIIVNGEKKSDDSLTINAFDRGITLGHGLFETIFIYNGKTPFLNYHWDRLVSSANLINIKIPFNLSELENMINELIKLNSLESQNGSVRLTITDGVAPRGILSSGAQEPTFIISTVLLAKITNKAMTAMIVKTRKNELSVSSKIKSTSYLDLILAKQEAVSQGFDEAFLLNSKSYLAEGSVTNIFVVKNNIVYTPRISDGALPGIARRLILTELTIEGIEIREERISIDFLFDADEIFTSNALLGITSICQLNNFTLPINCPITTLFQKNYQQLLSAYDEYNINPINKASLI